jgi:two-component system sensor kinase FixL
MTRLKLEHRSHPMAFTRVFSLPPAAIALGYIASYVLLDWASFIQPFAPYGITPWNPPTGLSFVLVLLFGQRYVPLLFAAPLLADLLVRQLPLPWPVELAVCVVIGGGYAAGLAFLLRPETRFNPALASMRDLVLLLVVAGVSSAAVAACYVGVLAGAGVAGPESLYSAALRFWIGDVIGIAVVAPFALIVLTRGRTLRITRETALQIVAIIAALAFVFIYAEKHRFEFFYILFLPVIWMAVRGGLELVTLGILLTQVGLILGVQLLPQEGVDIAAFQALMLVLAMSGLAAGAVVTEHRRTEAQLRLHQDSLAHVARLGTIGEFAAMIAHEINQPLMAAGTYTRLTADTLRSVGPAGAAALETAEKAATQAQRAADVVRQLRALIRLDQTGRAPVAVERVVRESLDLCRIELDRQGITTRVDIDANLPPVMIDLLQIEQVMLNLMRNSAEAMSATDHSNRVITITANSVAANLVQIKVRDKGPGFPAEFNGAAFPPLSSTKSEGLGVGLALCRSIIVSHGGELTVGGGPDGAIVSFTLPTATTG